MAPASISIDLDEGVPLGYALVAQVAEEHHIRGLAIKGPTLAALGLREQRTSLDVDFLADPSAFAQLQEALAGVGWRPVAPVQATGHVLTPHSVTLAHPGWPIELDIHRYFPGFLADEQVTFDRLWSTRTYVVVAGRQMACPSRSASAAVALLHLLRAGERRDTEMRVLASRLREVLTADEVQELATLAEDLGSIGPLRPALAILLRQPRLPAADKLPYERMARWELSRDAGGARTVGWLVRFRDADARTWPRLIWRALWLSEAELRVRYPGARPDVRGRMAMVLDRWWQGLRGLPRAIKILRDHRRGP